jgi:hypothetical protein
MSGFLAEGWSKAKRIGINSAAAMNDGLMHLG